MGGLLAVAVYSAFGFAALVDRTDRANAVTIADQLRVVKSELPTCAQDFVRRWDEQLKCTPCQERGPQSDSPWERMSKGTLTKSPLARNITGRSAKRWHSVH